MKISPATIEKRPTTRWGVFYLPIRKALRDAEVGVAVAGSNSTTTVKNGQGEAFAIDCFFYILTGRRFGKGRVKVCNTVILTMSIENM